MDPETQAKLAPGTEVVVPAVVDRVQTEAIHGIDAVTVRITNAQALGRHDAEARVVVTPDKPVEATRLLHFASEHTRLVEYLRGRAEAIPEHHLNNDHGAVDWAIELIERLDG